MFDTKVYVQRREALKKKLKSGIALFLGNNESPMNYPANTFAYRQDSSFLYYWGLDAPNFAALIDVDNNRNIIFGDDFEVDDIIWMGPQPTVAEQAKAVGVNETLPNSKLQEMVRNAMKSGRRLHYLPQYRHDNIFRLEQLTGILNSLINEYVSEELIRGVVEQRLIKSDIEVAQIEIALSISYEMNRIAMKESKPRIYEHEVYGMIEGAVLQRGSMVSFPMIFTTRGEVLHGHSHANMMLICWCLILAPNLRCIMPAISPGRFRSVASSTNCKKIFITLCSSRSWNPSK